jgi:GNAT superfamily N-acetyltransferase
VSIREAGPADLEEVLALIGELAVYEDMADQVQATAEGLSAALFGERAVVSVSLACADDGAVVGMALWYPTFSTFLGRRGIWLEDLFVREAHRGRGHGLALMEHLRTKSDGRIEWEVLDWNQPAINFYEQLGARAHRGWIKYRWTG